MLFAFRAGASLTPSPVIPTIWPACCNARTSWNLSSGNTPANTSHSPAAWRSSPTAFPYVAEPARLASAKLKAAQAAFENASRQEHGLLDVVRTVGTREPVG